MSLHDPKPDLSAIVGSLTPYKQIAALRLIAEEFSWCDDAYLAIVNAANQIDNELLAENAAANGYAYEVRA